MNTRNLQGVTLYDSAGNEIEINENSFGDDPGTYFNEILYQRDSLNYDAIGEYKGNPEDFLWTAPDGNAKYYVARLLVLIEDTQGFEPDSYGASGAGPLDNGINVFVKRDGEPKTYLTPVPILVNIDWGLYCYDTKYSDYGGGNETLEVRWSFNKASPVGIVMSEKDEFGLELNDDFDHLVKHRFVIQGYSVP